MRFVSTVLLFLPMAAAGTLIHEGGHFAAGWVQGLSPVLHYGGVSWDPPPSNADPATCAPDPRWSTAECLYDPPLGDGVILHQGPEGTDYIQVEMPDIGSWLTTTYDVPDADGVPLAILYADCVSVDGSPVGLRGVSVFQEVSVVGPFTDLRHRLWRHDGTAWQEDLALRASVIELYAEWVDELGRHVQGGGQHGVLFDVRPTERGPRTPPWPTLPELGHRLAAEGIVDPPSTQTWATAMGPLTNMTLGTIGAVWLARRRQGRWREPLDGPDALAVLAALCWSRQVFNPCMGLWYAAQGQLPLGSDEIRLAMDFGWPFWILEVAWGLPGLAVCLAVVAQVPRPVVFTIAGGLGSVLGFALWYGWLGPWLLP